MIAKPLRRTEAAAYLSEKGYPISPATLAKFATIGGGPKYQTFGRLALYEAADLDEWVTSRLCVRQPQPVVSADREVE